MAKKQERNEPTDYTNNERENVSNVSLAHKRRISSPDTGSAAATGVGVGGCRFSGAAVETASGRASEWVRTSTASRLNPEEVRARASMKELGEDGWLS